MSPIRRIGLAARSVASLLLLAVATAGAQEPGRYDHYTVEDPDLFPRSEYADRRARVMKELGEGEAMFLRSADIRNRSNDVDFEFRQRNSLLYLTGVTEPESALLLVPGGVQVGGKLVREVLFTAKRDPAKETWTGIVMGPGTARTITGIETAVEYEKLRSILDPLLPKLSVLYYDGFHMDRGDEPLAGTEIAWKEAVLRDLAAHAPRLSVKDAAAILTPMRMIKSDREIAMLRKAVDISLVGHRETIRSGKPGLYEYELQATMEYAFKRLGSKAPGYPSIVGSGPNSCILHYDASRRRSRPGELVLMDCGAEYHGYSADITRTFPVDGRFTPEQRAIYDLVHQAQKAAIDVCRSGHSFRETHAVAREIISDGLMRLGIITISTDVNKYFMHGTSHYLGLDVHDVGDYGTLAPGVVLTVEPGIYIREGSDCDPKWWNIGIRIEDNILVTDGDPINLSAAMPASASDIEALMNDAQ